MEMGPKISLDEGLDLRQVQTTGSVISINEVYNETDGMEPDEADIQVLDMIGEPLKNFTLLAEKMTPIDSTGFVKKFMLEEGGGAPVGEDFTVYVAFSAYWENENEPFDVVTMKKPMEVDLKDNGILPGLEMAIKTMLVGELSLFLFSHKVMYGEFGIPPRIKAAAQCIFYIKLLKSVVTPKKEKLNFSEPNMFKRVLKEAQMLFSSGSVLYKSMNLPLACSLFRKAIAMLHKCRLADEAEEKIQEKLLIKLYLNLAICNNKMKQPLQACIACNELNRLNSLWNNGKALFQNAKALRMIGEYDSAEKRLKRAIHLFPNSVDMKAELELLVSTRDLCDQNKLINTTILGPTEATFERFKKEVDDLINNFKRNVNLCKITLPPSLNSEEMAYVKEACIRENLFFNKLPINYTKNTETESSSISKENLDQNFMMDKEDQESSCDLRNGQSIFTLDEEILRQVDLLASTQISCK